MLSHLLRAVFRRPDAHVDRMVAAALDDTDDLTAVMDATAEPAYVEPTPLAVLPEPDPTPLATAAADFLRSSLAALDAMDTVEDFLWLTGEDA